MLFAYASRMHVLLPALACAWLTAAGAAEPSADPLLRIDTAMHTTLIRRMAYDAAGARLATVSDDKTLRLWRLPDLRLLRTLRVPIDRGHEGQLFAVAVSPDGRQIAVGGWTGWDWERKACVYLFDSDSGEIVARLDDFADAIGALAWSPDGANLAVGLQARAGLHLVRLSDRRVIAHDGAYNDKIMDLQFAPDGRLAAVALDGMARLYAPGLRLSARRQVPGGGAPAALRFTPDGAQLAVALADRPALALLSAHDLSALTAQPVVPARWRGLHTVAWSDDGRTLYAAGEGGEVGGHDILRWDLAALDAPHSIAAAAQRVSEVLALPGGRIAWAAEDPAIGVVDAHDRPLARQGPEVADFSTAHGLLEVSADGGVVRFPLGGAAGVPQVFAVATAAGQGGAPALTHAPRLAADDLAVDIDPAGVASIGTRRLRLDDHERARSYAIGADARSVLLGSEWALRLYARDGTLLWRVGLPAVAWAVNLARDGRLAVAALSDGTIRWYRAGDGAEVLAYFPHASGREWIAWVPEGYYMSSLEGDAYVGWHLNRGRATVPDFHRAVQFERLLYRPDRVLTGFQHAQRVRTRALEAGLPARGFDIARLREIAPPRLRVRVAAAPEASDGMAELLVEGERGGPPMRDYAVFVNGIPVTPAAQRALSGDEAQRFVRRTRVRLAAGENEIRVESFNGVSMGVAQARVRGPAQAPAAPPGELYVLAIGVNRFEHLDPSATLSYAAQDAREVANTLKVVAGGAFAQVHARVLSDAEGARPTRAAVVEALDFVARAGPADTVVVFLASHGISDPAGNYHFVPADARAADVAGVPLGRAGDSLVPWTVFFDALRRTAGRRVLIVDTCQARNIEGRFAPHALMKRSAAARFALIVAARGDEQSQEYAPARHGLFTWALLAALDPRSDADRDGRVSLGEVFAAAAPIVEALRDRGIGPQTPQLVLPEALADTALLAIAPTGAARVELRP